MTKNQDKEQFRNFSFGNHPKQEVASESDDEENDGSEYIEITLEPTSRFHFRLSCSNIFPRMSDSESSLRCKFSALTESLKSTSMESWVSSSDSYSISSSSSSSSSAVLSRSNGGRNHRAMVLETHHPPTPSENKWRKAVVKLMMLSLARPPDSKSTSAKLIDGKRSKAIKSGLTKLMFKFKTIKAKTTISITRASNLMSGSKQVAQSGHSDIERPRRYFCLTEPKIYTRENSIQAAIAHCKMSFYV